ncbi:fatty acid cis/trans isomerase [Catenovulum adriaticum]|uniref:Fatty acid cis/trans isomerase n=1 Tax=Catenovulum adriaticum TaxID=2984846 RepID=A0ABY7AT42_9ALTE|nr:fatty acid cis/trans isomerase [Catenovulum sp. TS8]WAJ72291.1 fatty acid cis/trans isomerase [Catenovulum sp. TS8]
MLKKVLFVVSILILPACAMLGFGYYDQMFGEAKVQNRMVAPDSLEGQAFLNDVKPIVEQRCVVCHGCYDAPCQLKMSSPAGIDRGINQQKVYNGTRLLASEPSRLFIDAHSTQAWRNRDFEPVLNERAQTSQANLAASALYKTLALKQKQAAHLNETDNQILDKKYDFSLNRAQTCTYVEDYDNHAEQNPHLGMPYGLPAISSDAFNTLTEWLAQGGKMADIAQPSKNTLAKVAQWEDFLNQDSLKQQLISRYIYEHWFLAHLYFKPIEGQNEQPAQFFKLVRSSTPPGQPLDIISTRRPFEDPKIARVYYRFMQDKTSVLAKTHLPLALSEQKLSRIKQLFVEPDYPVTRLPSYEIKKSSNPFVSFAQLPVKARYQFMLDDAQFIIMGFIKGPVCRGQVALNVINDHFWVVFADPDLSATKAVNDFLLQYQEKLSLPAAEDSNALPMSNWVKYAERESEYMAAKAKLANQLFESGEHLTEKLIWQGDGSNDNAALSIFRHFDSASVVKGLVGQDPKTAWIIDYPMFERIHYLLVAGFDVYGNVGHQLLTRLYMDFLRLEGERNLLALLPKNERQPIKQFWYRRADKNLAEYLKSKKNSFNQPSGIEYQTKDVQAELYQLIKTRLEKVNSQTYQIETDEPLAKLNKLPARAVNLLPPVSVIMVEENSQHQVFSLLHNNAHFNISSLLDEDGQRAYKEDYATVTPGLIGDYPQAIWYLKKAQVDDFMSQLANLDSEKAYRKLKAEYGIRRTHPDFWHYSDLLHQITKKQRGIEYGLLDYNRLENR